MALSQNGWPALESGDPLLHQWVIPAKTGEARVLLRNGSAGFLLSHMLLWFAEAIEPLQGKVLDDWGYAYRPIRGATTGLSNHSSATAVDVNALAHPLGVDGTFSPKEVAKIRGRLKLYRGAIRWGGDFNLRTDSMHFEINESLHECEVAAKRLLDSPRGKRLLKANPDQKAVILS